MSCYQTVRYHIHSKLVRDVIINYYGFDGDFMKFSFSLFCFIRVNP